MVEMETKNDPPGFMTLLSSAACEWLLIFLMFLDAALSYFLTKLAHYCELPAPCILCARFEHVLGHDKAGNYRNLLCRNHKAEISCLMSCQIHDKLADVHLMCEECFTSIAMQNKSNPESYKLLISKLGLTFEGQSQLVRSIKEKPCSCCNKTWRSKSNVQRISHLTTASFGDSRVNVRPPLPRAPSRNRFNRRDSTRTKMRDSGTHTSRRSTHNNMDDKSVNAGDPLSHVGYTELKINSDSESDFMFSDDDDVSIPDTKERTDLVRSQSDPSLMRDKNIQDSDSGRSVLDYVRHNGRKRKPNNVRTLKLKSEIPNLEPNPDAKPSSDVLSEISDNCSSTERSKIDVSKQPISLEAPPEASSEKGAAPLLLSIEKDIPNISKLVFNNKGRELLVSSDVSSSSSPKTYVGLQDAIKRSELAMLDRGLTNQRSGSAERSDPGYESIESGSVSEIDGESVVDKLKRQVEYDKKCMSSLCKELEEERNASAIAANQAMAMITRLQEEKAALHMEALQYLRMMEEQAEYDMDALEKSNDVIVEKDRQIQDLELELEFYKLNNCDEDTDGVDDDKSYVDAKKSPLDSARTVSADLRSPVLGFDDGKTEER